MSVSKELLEASLEEASCLIHSVSNAFTSVDVNGVRGYFCSVSHPHVNLVYNLQGKRIGKKEIRAVLDIFKGENLAFGWVTSPFTTPGLENILLDNGFYLHDEMDALAITDFSKIPEPKGDYIVREVESGEMELFWLVYSQGMPAPLEKVRYFGKAICNQDEIEVTNYLAFKHGIAVGAASMVMFGDRPIVKMSAAAVLEDYRRMGIYHAMISRRITEAKKRGAESAIVQAITKTSSPICQKVGFERIFGMNIYAWEPKKKEG